MAISKKRLYQQENNLESSNNHFIEANNELSKTNQLMFKGLKKFQAELDRYHDVKYASKVAIDCAKAKVDLMSYKIESKKSSNEYTRKINDLNQTILDMKKELFAHQETIFIMSQEKEAQIKFYKTGEDKELDKVIALENKVKVLDDIVYKTDEVSNLQCDYLETLEKCEHLEKELSKSRTMPKSFEALQKHAINLELDLQQYLKAQLQDKRIAISELKKLIEKIKEKSDETKFEKSSVIRQPNAFKSQRQSVLGKPAIFSDSLEKKDFSKSKSVTKNNVSNDFSKPVTAQILPQNIKSILKNTNVIALGMSNFLSSTSVSKPQLKSNRMGDRVIPNNSQGKKQEVENHRRNFKFSNNKTFVTACNDNLNAKTSNLVEIILFIVDSGCSKHMTRNLKLLTTFIEKFLGTVKFRNDQIAPILGYGDLVQGTITIKWVYYVEGLNHNLFSVGQFCNADLEVTFRKYTCYIRDLKENDLLTGSRGTYLYSINLQDTSTPNPICLMAKAHRLNHGYGIMASDHISSDPVPQCPTTVLEQDSLSPDPQSQENVPQAAETSIRTRSQLETDGELCMFALTVSRTEPKNIKETMVDSAWIEAMQKELHQFDQLDIWELVDRPLCKNVINMKWL
ncbi:hypothetical protein Tco_1022324 [Tanacetum coccineum]